MSISFNHPSNTMTSTGSLNLTVTGGNTSSPQPIRFNSTSIVMPVRALPSGEAGAMVFDTGTKTMKYHNGMSWIELLDPNTIIAPVLTEIANIKVILGTKVDKVAYSSAAVPQASISGTQLNIVFPTGGGGGGGGNGLFTSSKQGAIQYYALTSGMNAATIREQMSGVANGQAGRNGTQANPWISNDGWTYSDGMWWTWLGADGTVTVQVPNLNQNAYLKPMALSGQTQITSVISASASLSNTSLTISQLPAHNFTVSGNTSIAGEHVHDIRYNPMGWSGGSNVKDGTGRDTTGAGVHVTQPAGNHIHQFSGTTNTLGNNEGHTHTVSGLDVARLTVAALYNIATPSYALNESAANGKYVLKAGDTMTGSLTIASNATVRGNDTNITFTFRNSANAERAMIYHSTTTNTLRFRSNGGTEMTLDGSGNLTATGIKGTALSVTTSTVSTNTSTVGGRNVARSVNGTYADANGNITLPTGAYVSGLKFGKKHQVGVSENRYIPGECIIGWANGDKKELRGAAYWSAPAMYLVGSTWTMFSNDG